MQNLANSALGHNRGTLPLKDTIEALKMIEPPVIKREEPFGSGQSSIPQISSACWQRLSSLHGERLLSMRSRLLIEAEQAEETNE